MPDSYILFIILIALAFDFINGFHDAANSIATVVSTRVLTPRVAVFWAAFFNFAAAFGTGTFVAETIGKGVLQPETIDPNLILAALLGAIVWNLITWYYGIPSSSSHALIGGLAGAGLVKAGSGSLIWLVPGPNLLIWKGILGIALYIVIAPLLGFFLGILFTVACSWICRRCAPQKVDNWFRKLQLLSAAIYSYSHGSNDAQKTMGIIFALLVGAGYGAVAYPEGVLEYKGRIEKVNAVESETLPGYARVLVMENGTRVPIRPGREADHYSLGREGQPVTIAGRLEPDLNGRFRLHVRPTLAIWIILSCYAAIAFGTYFGGWRIVKTMGSKITKLTPFGGFCAETGGGVTILAMSHWGIPVSTTHTIAGAITGVGATKGTRAVKWGIAGRLLWAWILTIPCAALIAAAAEGLFILLGGR
jgi:PiT family inorganic phosphate transporter